MNTIHRCTFYTQTPVFICAASTGHLLQFYLRMRTIFRQTCPKATRMNDISCSVCASALMTGGTSEGKDETYDLSQTFICFWHIETCLKRPFQTHYLEGNLPRCIFRWRLFISWRKLTLMHISLTLVPGNPMRSDTKAPLVQVMAWH